MAERDLVRLSQPLDAAFLIPNFSSPLLLTISFICFLAAAAAAAAAAAIYDA